MDPVPAPTFTALLRDLDEPPRFVFLSSCHTADAGAPTPVRRTAAQAAADRFAAQVVTTVGLPAVVAMADEVSVDTALPLARAFYEELFAADGAALPDLALASATARLLERYDVFVPVLYTCREPLPLFVPRRDDGPPEPDADAFLGALPRLRRQLALRAPAYLATDPRRVPGGIRERLFPALARRLEAARSPAAESAAWRAALGELRAVCAEALEIELDELALGVEPPVYCDWRPDDGPDDGCPSPFPGLRSFGFDQRRFYFGRLDLAQGLADRLTGRADDESAGFLAVVGPSGCGKSSLVLAAVAPRVQPDTSPAYLTPGKEPLARLDAALATIPAEPPAGPQPPLLVVDQFEELFTQGAAEADEFVRRLVALTADNGSRRCLVALTMRSEFWGEVARFPDLKALMMRHQHQELISVMDPDDLAQAMRLQVAAAALRLEDGLDTTILNAVHAQSGAMPLLQQALAQLWELRRGRLLTAEAYEFVGGVERAIALSAETAFAELVGEDPGNERRLRNIFFRLINLDDQGAGGALRRGTRRRATFAELVADGDDPAVVAALVRRLADGRLVTTAGDPAAPERDQVATVEIAHEALVQHWERLQGWLAEDQTAQGLYEEVREAAAAWHDAVAQATAADARPAPGEPPGTAYLAHEESPRYELAQQLVEAGRYPLSAVELAYLEACTTAREQEEARRRQQLRRTQMGLAAVTVLLVIAAIASVLAWNARNESERRAMDNLALAVAGRAEAFQASRDDELAALLARQAYLFDRATSPETSRRYHALLRTAATTPTFGWVVGALTDAADTDFDFVSQPVISPDGRYGAVRTSWSSLEVWSIDDRAAILRWADAVRTVSAIDFLPDGRLIAVSFEPRPELLVWNLSSGDPAPAIRPLAASDRATENRDLVVLSGPGRFVAAQYLDYMSSTNPLVVWNLPDGTLAETPCHESGWDALYTISRDRSTLVAVDVGMVRTWELDNPACRLHEYALPELGFDEVPQSYAVSDDARFISLSLGPGQSPTGPVRSLLLDTETGWFEPLTDADGEPVSSRDAVFAATGEELAASSGDQLLVWATTDPTFDGQKLSAAISVTDAPIAFFPGEDRLLAGAGQALRVWELRPPGASYPIPGLDPPSFGLVRLPAWSDDGRWLAGFAPERGLLLWNVRDLEAGPVAPAGGAEGASLGAVMALSRDGALLAMAGDDDVRVWETAHLDRSPITLAEEAGNIAFVPGQSQLLLLDKSPFTETTHNSYFDFARPRLWDLETGDVRTVATPGDYIFSTAAADGRLLFLTPRGVSAWQPASDTVVDVSAFPNGRLPCVDPDAYPTALAASHDGARLALGCSDGTVAVDAWSAPDTPWSPLPGARGLIDDLLLAPDGERLTIAHHSFAETAIETWHRNELEDGPVRLLTDRNEDISATYAAADAAGRWLAIADGASLRLLALREDDLAIAICARVGRNLTLAEWRRFVSPEEPYRQTCPNHPPAIGAPASSPVETLPGDLVATPAAGPDATP
jgi:WD40 repeat protein